MLICIQYVLYFSTFKLLCISVTFFFTFCSFTDNGWSSEHFNKYWQLPKVSSSYCFCRQVEGILKHSWGELLIIRMRLKVFMVHCLKYLLISAKRCRISFFLFFQVSKVAVALLFYLFFSNCYCSHSHTKHQLITFFGSNIYFP